MTSLVRPAGRKRRDTEHGIARPKDHDGTHESNQAKIQSQQNIAAHSMKVGVINLYGELGTGLPQLILEASLSSRAELSRFAARFSGH